MDNKTPDYNDEINESVNLDEAMPSLLEISDDAAVPSEADADTETVSEIETEKTDEAEVAEETESASENNAAVEVADAKTTDTELPRVSRDHKFDDDDDEYDELAFELERKRTSKRRTVATLIISFVILFAIAAASVAMRFVFTPEKTVVGFINAMETANLTALQENAEIRDGKTELTARNTAPMFALYKESETFRSEIYDCLQNDIAAIKRGEAPKNGDMVDIEISNFVLFKLYKISIARAEATVYTNFSGSKVSVNDMTQVAYATKGHDYNAYGYTVSPDYFDFVDSKAVFEDILPGNYTLRVEYLSSFGEKFEATETLEVMNEDVECRLDVSFEGVDIRNATDYDVSVIMNDAIVQEINSGATFKMFPVTAGNVITVLCDVGDGTDILKEITAGESESVDLAFAAFTVDNSDNGAAVDVYINGQRIDPIAGYAEPIRLYPLNYGDKIEFLPTETKYQSLVMPLAVEVTEQEGGYKIIFEMRDGVYSGVDQLVSKDIVDSFAIINEGHTKEELAELVLEHKTLAEMIDYAFNEETLMYSKLTEPQITIDLSQDTRAYFAHDTMNMYVEANIKFQVGYHEAEKEPVEFTDKEITLSYTLMYQDGKWVFPEVTGEH